MALDIVSFPDACDLFGVKFSTAKLFEERTGLSPVQTYGRMRFYARAAVAARVATYREEMEARKRAQAARMQHLRYGVPTPVPAGTDPLDTRTASDLRAEIIGLRSESSAAFNLIMDELSKIKTQLVSMEKAP